MIIWKVTKYKFNYRQKIIKFQLTRYFQEVNNLWMVLYQKLVVGFQFKFILKDTQPTLPCLVFLSTFVLIYFSVHQSRRREFDRGTMFSEVELLQASIKLDSEQRSCPERKISQEHLVRHKNPSSSNVFRVLKNCILSGTKSLVMGCAFSGKQASLVLILAN